MFFKRNVFQRILRIGNLALVVLLYLVKALWIHLSTADHHLRRKRFSENVCRSSGKALDCFNIRLEVVNPPPKDRHFLIVCNHLGYLDIFALASTVPTLFVTSVEMKETPFLGLLTEMGGCMYVERRNRSNIQNEIKEIESALNEGFNVVIFPEGRATNGEKILPFKKSLLMACAGSEANILPAVINFRTVNGEPMGDAFRDWVCWYDDMGFLESIWNASQIEECHMTLTFLEEVLVSDATDRRDIAHQAQAQIEAHFISILKPSGTL